jgi:hypothetical protein
VKLLLVLQEIAAAVDTIDGLNCFWYAPDRITPPAFIVDIPESIDFNATYARGMDVANLEAFLLVGKADDKASLQQLAPYCDGSGDKSIIQKLQSRKYESCADVTVPKVEFDVIKIGGTDHLAARFTITASGSGE